MGSESIRSIEFKITRGKAEAQVQVRLAADIPACCGVSDGAYIEFLREGHWERADLTLREDKAGNILEGTAALPGPGAYPYRLMARILGMPTIREGTAILS